MSKVDFYVLKDNKNKLQFVCHLLEKAYQQKSSVYVHTADQQSANQLDDYLWTFRDNSFIPHALSSEGYQPAPPIQIGFAEKDRIKSPILINLSNQFFDFHTQYQRVIEIVDEQNKDQLREYFKKYREQQCDLTTYNV